jgi:transmembrane sensor
MSNQLKKEVRLFLEGKPSPEGEKIWKNWFARPTVSTNKYEQVVSLPSDLRKEIRKIKHKSFKILGLNYPQLQIAASIAVVVAIGSWFSFSGAIETFWHPTIYLQNTTRAGELAKIHLSDGTQIWLNSGSVLKYPKNFKGDTREVYLEGEAFFDVAKDKKHPFVIHTQKMDTKVVGTSFNIRAYTNQTNQEVLVVTGKVSVSSTVTQKKVFVTCGQKASLEKRSNDLKAYANVNISKIATWRKRALIFDNVLLKEVIAVIERQYKIKIELQGTGLENLKINANLEELELQQILNLLCKTINATYKQLENNYIIKSNE